MVIQNEKRDGHFQQILALWKLERRVHSGENQIIPTFVGRVLQLFGTETFQTVLTFLSSIPCPITEFSTVCETIYRSIHLSKISNMKCRHIAVDDGAAEKYYKVIWNNPDEFEDVSGIFMLSCIFLVTVENLLLTVGSERLYTRQQCV